MSDPIEVIKGVGGLTLTENNVIAHSTDIFSLASQEASMKSGRSLIIRPLNMSDDGPFEFEIPPLDLQYMMPSATRLEMKLKIVQEDGANLPADAVVGFINGIGTTLFNTITVDINTKPLPELTNSLAQYKSYFENVLTYGYDARNTALRAQQFHMDTNEHFESFTHNLGLNARKAICKESKTFQVSSPIHSDFFQTDKLLPPGLSILLRLHRAADSFVIMTNDNKRYKLKMMDMKLYVRFITLSNELTSKHINLFEKRPAIYPLLKTVIKTKQYATGLQAVSWPNMFVGRLPKSLILGILASENFNGNYAKNPFNFKHHSCTDVSLKVNGAEVPTGGYHQDFDDLIFLKSYQEFQDNIGILHDNVGNVVSPDYYRGGCAFYAFDLSPDLCNGYHFHEPLMGNIHLDLTFKNATTEPLTVVAFSSFDMLITIDQFRNVFSDTTNL